MMVKQMHKQWAFFCAVALVVAGLSNGNLLADEPAAADLSTSNSAAASSGAIAAALSKPKPGNKSPSFTPEREAAALAFVQANHAELAAVLTQLKTMQREQYETAIRDLFRVSEELARAKDQDSQRYALELQAWQAKSRVQLLAARASVSKDPAVESELRAALERQTDVQIAQLKAQRDQAAERVKKLSDSLANLERDRKKQIDKQFAGLVRDVRRGPGGKKAHKKPATEKPSAEKPTADKASPEKQAAGSKSSDKSVTDKTTSDKAAAAVQADKTSTEKEPRQ